MTRLRKGPLAAALALAAGLATTPAVADDPAIGRAEAAVSRGDYALAEKELTSVRSGPDRAKAELAAARLMLLSGRYEAAIAAAKSAAGLGRGARADAAALRAEALAAQGKIQEAIAACREVQSDDAARRARLVLGELLIRSGKRGDARAPLMTIVQDYNDDKITASDAEGLAMVGRAAHLLRSPRDANDAYNQAEKAGAKKLVDALLWRADLYLDKYDPGHAGEVVREALKLAPRDPRVRT